jgi:hypothetical protein
VQCGERILRVERTAIVIRRRADSEKHGTIVTQDIATTRPITL